MTEARQGASNYIAIRYSVKGFLLFFLAISDLPAEMKKFLVIPPPENSSVAFCRRIQEVRLSP